MPDPIRKYAQPLGVCKNCFQNLSDTTAAVDDGATGWRCACGTWANGPEAVPWTVSQVLARMRAAAAGVAGWPGKFEKAFGVHGGQAAQRAWLNTSGTGDIRVVEKTVTAMYRLHDNELEAIAKALDRLAGMNDLARAPLEVVDGQAYAPGHAPKPVCACPAVAEEARLVRRNGLYYCPDCNGPLPDCRNGGRLQAESTNRNTCGACGYGENHHRYSCALASLRWKRDYAARAGLSGGPWNVEVVLTELGKAGDVGGIGSSVSATFSARSPAYEAWNRSVRYGKTFVVGGNSIWESELDAIALALNREKVPVPLAADHKNITEWSKMVEQKMNLLERLLTAWVRTPGATLGKLLAEAGVDQGLNEAGVLAAKDEELVAWVEKYTARRARNGEAA